MKKWAACFMFVMVALAASIASAEPRQWRAADGGNDHWYDVVIHRDAQGAPAAITWDNARAAAEARSGNWHLVTVTSASENAFVFSLLSDPNAWVVQNQNYYGPWIGAYRYYTRSLLFLLRSEFLWVNGEQFDYENWRSGEPSGNGEDYVHFLGQYQREGTWNDLSDGNSVLPVAYIIETSNQNQPPVLNPIGNKLVQEGETLSFTLSASDANGDNLTFAAANIPLGAYFSNNSREFKWVTDYGDAGNYRVTFTVTDDSEAFSASDSETVTITVGHVNRPPVLAPIGGRQVEQGGSVAFTINATDPEGDNLNYSVDNLPLGATFNAHNGTFSWTTDARDTGNYRVTFTVSDDGSPPLSDSETVSITVGEVNQPPVLGTIGNRALFHGDLLEFTVTASDPDRDSLFFDAGDLPAGAAFDPVTHIFTWEPTHEDEGNHYILFTVTDSGRPPLSDSETVIVTVGDVNRPPVMSTAGNHSVSSGESLEFGVSAFDSDNHNLSFSAGDLPVGASFDGTSRTFSWMPEDRDEGNHQVTFTVTDDGTPSLGDSRAVTITVGNVNRPPVLGRIGNKVVETEQLIFFAVTATDPDNDVLQYSAQGLADGAVFDESRQLFYWMPTSDDIGLHILRFSVVDEGIPPLSDELVVDVKVTAAAAAAGDGGSKDDTGGTPEEPAEIIVKGGSGGGCFIRLSAN